MANLILVIVVGADRLSTADTLKLGAVIGVVINHRRLSSRLPPMANLSLVIVPAPVVSLPMTSSALSSLPVPIAHSSSTPLLFPVRLRPQPPTPRTGAALTTATTTAGGAWRGCARRRRQLATVTTVSTTEAATTVTTKEAATTVTTKEAVTTATTTILCVLSFTDSLSYLGFHVRSVDKRQISRNYLYWGAAPSHPILSPLPDLSVGEEDGQWEDGSAPAVARGARPRGLGRWSATVGLDLVTTDAAGPWAVVLRFQWISVDLCAFV
ncbi:hypothetical protein OsI_35779 [Oryza sativa Indica Group]|uniref:Uncharacterized protein n=1 Tax=Oryza sativa subsp. indica TaxID=39946 RepID=B8BK09_ORYSI|nr:hypothetical protein OsI_35779 [Oryza sativa Indica Group]